MAVTANETGAMTRPAAGPTLLSSEDVGAANKAKVMQALADHGPLSRADLARMAGVPRGTIGAIVNNLIAAGLLQETAVRRTVASVGQPPRPLWFGPRLGHSGAILIQPGAIRAAVVDVHGTIITEKTTTFPVSATRRALERQLLVRAMRVLRPFIGDLAGVGIAVPALCDAESAQVLACTPLPGLVGTHLPQLLTQETGVPTILEEDVRALALGQRWFGQARGIDNFVALQIGTGIGAAIMNSGRLLRGESGMSEVGHTCVDIKGERCGCGLTGCWETIASTHWLRDQALRRGIAGEGSAPRRLAARAEAGDATADDLLHLYADHIAIGIANMVHLLSLPLFILHGEVIHGGAYLRTLIQEAVTRRTLAQFHNRATVEFSALDQEAGVLGAAAAVITRHLAIAA
jgi:predicted NBD/HSP70 family sugar kinase